MNAFRTVSVFALVSSFVLGCANTADQGTGGSGSSSTSTGGSAATTHCVPGESTACTCSGGAKGAQVCKDDGTYGDCDCSGGAPTDAGTGGNACVQRTVWFHYNYDDDNGQLGLLGADITFQWWNVNGSPVQDQCHGALIDAASPHVEYFCEGYFCENQEFVFQVNLTGGGFTMFAFDVCDGHGEWCEGKGNNCTNIVGGPNASVWLTTDDPKNGQTFWLKGNSGPTIGKMADNHDGLSCTNNGDFTVPSN